MDSVIPILTVLAIALCITAVIPSDFEGTGDAEHPYGEYCGQTAYGDTYIMHLNDRDMYVAYQETEHGLVTKIIA